MSEKRKNQTDSIRLLLVDDEVGFTNVIAKRMSRRNIDVTKAFSGAEALQAVRKADFDVAVLDLKMEDMDGIEVLKIIKKMDPNLSVIMLTGHGSEEAAREGIQLGAIDYLTKPCDFKELVKKIIEIHRCGGVMFTENFNVLLVDDELEFLEIQVKRLTKRGLNITMASSGEEGLSVIKGKKFDVAVLDVGMPGMDGIETLREMKKIDPLMEVIMLTGHASVEVAIEGMELGAFDYLMKPMDVDELFYKLQDALKRKKIQEKKIKKFGELL